MRKHPPDTEIVRAALADAREAVTPTTRAHLDAGCERCRKRLEELSAVIAALGAPALADAPAAIVARASAWLASQAAAAGAPAGAPAGAVVGRARRRLMQALEEVRAVLVLDTAPGATLAGIRGAADAHGRRLLYESPVGNLHLQIEPLSAGRIAIHGQFLPASADPDPASGRAVLGTSHPGVVCRLSDAGEFHFDDEAAGEVRLQIEWGGRRIVIDPVDASGS